MKNDNKPSLWITIIAMILAVPIVIVILLLIGLTFRPQITRWLGESEGLRLAPPLYPQSELISVSFGNDNSLASTGWKYCTSATLGEVRAHFESYGVEFGQLENGMLYYGANPREAGQSVAYRFDVTPLPHMGLYLEESNPECQTGVFYRIGVTFWYHL